MIYYDNKEFSNETKFDVYILNKYLTKTYGKEKAITLIQKYKKDLNKLAKSLGKQNIAFFCEYFLRKIFVVSDDNEARTLSRSHYDMWKLLNETFVQDKQDKVNIVVSRGFAKTTVCDLALSVWLICYNKSAFTLLIAKRDDDATQFLDSIKKVFTENNMIIDNFGLLINRQKYKVNANECEFANGTYIRAMGSTTSCRGANFKGIRPTVVIGDDAQAEVDILTEDAREKKYNRWLKEVEQVGDKAVYRHGKKIKSATKIVSIGTVLHIDCLISRLSRNKDYKTFLRRAIILEPDQTVEDIFESELWLECKKIYFNDKALDSKADAKRFYEEHKDEMKFPVLWEEKWDCFNDLAVQYWENRISFMSEMMNDATSIGEKWFKSVRTEPKEYFSELNYSKTMLCVDPASTTNKKSDYTAIILGSQTSNRDFVYVRDLLMQRLTFDQYCNKVVEMLVKHEDITHICIEKNTFQGADVLKIQELIDLEPKLKRRKFEFINKMQRANKDEKISTIIDMMNNGQIIINKDCEDSKEVIQQITEFQGQQYSVHDDAPDCIAECVTKLKDMKQISKITLLDRSLLF